MRNILCSCAALQIRLRRIDPEQILWPSCGSDCRTMPVRIEFGPQGSDLHSWKMCDFFQSQSAFELLETPSIAQLTLERLVLQEALQGCCTPKFQPKAEPFMFGFNSPSKSTTMNEFDSPSKSTTTASDIHHRYNSPATSTTTASDVSADYSGRVGGLVSQYPPEVSQYPSILGRPNFGGIVLGCIEADFCKQILI